MTVLSAIRNDSSTAFFSHSLTRQPSAVGSATRAVPASSSASAASTAWRTTGLALAGVISARASKAASRVSIRSCMGFPLRRVGGNQSVSAAARRVMACAQSASSATSARRTWPAPGLAPACARARKLPGSTRR